MIINPYAPSEEIFNSAFSSVLNVSNNRLNSVSSISNGDDNLDEPKKVSFADALKSSLDAVNSQQINADNLTNSFIKGEDGVDISDVMLGTAEANTSLQYAVQVRNKLLDAYQEISKMQI